MAGNPSSAPTNAIAIASASTSASAAASELPRIPSITTVLSSVVTSMSIQSAAPSEPASAASLAPSPSLASIPASEPLPPHHPLQLRQQSPSQIIEQQQQQQQQQQQNYAVGDTVYVESEFDEDPYLIGTVTELLTYSYEPLPLFQCSPVAIPLTTADGDGDVPALDMLPAAAQSVSSESAMSIDLQQQHEQQQPQKPQSQHEQLQIKYVKPREDTAIGPDGELLLHSALQPAVPCARLAFFLRPKDIDKGRVKLTDPRILYATMHTDVRPISALRGHCTVRHMDLIPASELAAYREQPDNFYFTQFFDRHINRVYEAVPVSKVQNLPVAIKQKLRSTYEYVLVENIKALGLLESQRTCATCEKWCPPADSVGCVDCKRHFHLGCLNPPMAKKPHKNYAWQCTDCRVKAHVDSVEETLSKPAMKDRARSAALGLQPSTSSSSSPPPQPRSRRLQQQQQQQQQELGDGDSKQQQHQRAEPQDEFSLRKNSSYQWPYRYLGEYVSMEDVLTDDDHIYPRAMTRIGHKFQANVPDVLIQPPPQPPHLEQDGSSTGFDYSMSRTATPGLLGAATPSAAAGGGSGGSISAAGAQGRVWRKGRHPRQRGFASDAGSSASATAGGSNAAPGTPNVNGTLSSATPSVANGGGGNADGWWSAPSRSEMSLYSVTLSRPSDMEPDDLGAYFASANEVCPPAVSNTADLYDKAMVELHKRNYNTEPALEALGKMTARQFGRPTWTREEISSFEKGIRQHLGDLHSVGRTINTKRMGEVVQRFYQWVETPAGRKLWYDALKVYYPRKRTLTAAGTPSIAASTASAAAQSEKTLGITDVDSTDSASKRAVSSTGSASPEPMAIVADDVSTPAIMAAPGSSVEPRDTLATETAPGASTPVTRRGRPAHGDSASEMCVSCGTRSSHTWHHAPLEQLRITELNSIQSVVNSRLSRKKQPKMCSECGEWWLKYACLRPIPGRRTLMDEEQEDEAVSNRGKKRRGRPAANANNSDMEVDDDDRIDAIASDDEGDEDVLMGNDKKKRRTIKTTAPAKKAPYVPPPKPSPCAVCLRPDFEGDDSLLTCYGCTMSVHTGCYALPLNSTINRHSGKWLCDICTNGENPVVSINYKCVVCLDWSLGGYRVPHVAMKKTIGNNWIHVTCAALIPEAIFGSSSHVHTTPASAMGGSTSADSGPALTGSASVLVDGLRNISVGNWKSKCVACSTSFGATTECNSEGCKKHIHPACIVDRPSPPELSTKLQKLQYEKGISPTAATRNGSIVKECQIAIQAFAATRDSKKLFAANNIQQFIDAGGQLHAILTCPQHKQPTSMFGEVPQPIVSIPASAPSSADSNRDPTRAINVNASEADLLAFASAGDSAVAQAKGKPGRPPRTNKTAVTASATSVTSASSTSATIPQSQSQSQPQQSPQSLVVPREPPKPIEYTGTPPTVTLFRIGDRDNTGHPIFAAFIQRFKTISHLETAGRLKVLAVTHHMGAKTTVNLLPHADQFASKDSQAGKRKKSVGANRPGHGLGSNIGNNSLSIVSQALSTMTNGTASGGSHHQQQQQQQQQQKCSNCSSTCTPLWWPSENGSVVCNKCNALKSIAATTDSNMIEIQ